MKISKAWLEDYVDCSDLSAAELEDIITTRVAEVDEIITVGAPIADAVAVTVESVSPHPEKDKLVVAEISTDRAGLK